MAVEIICLLLGVGLKLMSIVVVGQNPTDLSTLTYLGENVSLCEAATTLNDFYIGPTLSGGGRNSSKKPSIACTFHSEPVTYYYSTGTSITQLHVKSGR